MFVIFYKDGSRIHIWDEHDLVSLVWSEISMVINTDNLDEVD